MKKITQLTTAVMLLGFGAETAYASVQWDVSVWGKRRAFTEHLEKLSELVAQKTNGDFKIKIHYGGVLSKSRENIDGISFGAFQMAQTCNIYHPKKTPALMVTSLPGLPGNNLRDIGKMSERVYKHPTVVKEFAKWNAKLFMPSPLPLYNLVGRGKIPATLNDFGGVRVRVGGGMADLVRKIGGNPVMFTAAEVYTAMDNGAVDAAAFGPHSHLSFKIYELGDYKTMNLNLGTVDCPVIMNIDAYKDLSPAHRKALDSSVKPSLEYYYESYGKYESKFNEVTKNMKAITYTKAERAKLQSLAEPIWNEWKAEMKKKGIDGQSLLDTVMNK